MPRAHKDNQIVDVFYSSRTTQVKGLGRVETYLQKERKYAVRMLSYRGYYIPGNYNKRRADRQPHDKILKAWSYELTPCYDMKPHIQELQLARTDAIKAMYNDVSSRIKNSSQYRDDAINTYFSDYTSQTHTTNCPFE